MAAQRKKGKNSNKGKAETPVPVQPGLQTVAPAHADSVSVSGVDAVEAVSDNSLPVAEPLSTSEIETALTEPPAGRNSLDINTESETLKKLEGVDETVAPESDEPELNLTETAVDSDDGGAQSGAGASDANAIGSVAAPAATPASASAPAATLVAEKPPETPITGDYKSAPEFRSENFSKNEIKTLLVPVNPLHRLIACVIVITCYSFLGYLYLNGPVAVNAHGLHTIDLPEAGDYLLIFKGDIQDAYGWTIDGRFRNSLEIDMEPVEPEQRVEKIEPIKDISGADFFSVAEYEVNQPGTYNLWVKWNDPAARCKGKITLEKDPVEKFIFKWAVGIIGTLALIYMCGIPMTTSKAQSTLEGHTTQA